MIKKITLVVIVGIGVIVFSIFNLQEKEDISGPVLGEASIMEVMLSFIESASNDQNKNIKALIETVSNDENKNIKALREITVEELEILDALKLPNLERNEKIIEFGVKISTQYNQESLDYSSGRITDNEYYTKLYNLRDYYQAYMTFMDSYIGEGDVLIQKKSMIEELVEIEKQINLLKFSENIYDDDQASGIDKYKKLLPSMFKP